MEFVKISLQITLGITFLSSGMLKIFALNDFVSSLEEIFTLKSRKYSKILGAGFSLMEVALGLGILIFDHIMLFIILSSLTILFIFINMRMIKENREVHCSCFGKLFNKPLGLGSLMHSLFLFLCCVSVIFIYVINFSSMYWTITVESFVFAICIFSFIFTAFSIRIVLNK